VKASPIKVTRFDPKTGEMLVDPKTKAIIEEVVPAKDFRPQPPKHPVLDDSKITLVQRGRVLAPTGRSVIAMTSYREAVVDFWAFHAHILTRDERATLLRSGGCSVLRPIEPEWKIGARMYLASDIEAEVVEVSESSRGFGTVFRIRDYRMMYLRRGVIGTNTPKTDKEGFAAPLDLGRERQAAIDSAYTRVPGQAVDDSGAVMEPHAYEQIYGDRSSRRALTQSKRRRKLSTGQLEARLRDAEAKNQAATVKVLKRKLYAARSSEKRAA
jgi:hypothetical protein